MNIRNKIYEILMDIRDDVDYEKEKALIDDKILESFEIIEIISNFEDVFNIFIPAECVVPSNFNSIDALCNMVEDLKR